MTGAFAAARDTTLRHLLSISGLLGVAGAKIVSINRSTKKKKNYHGEGHCVCYLNYKRKDVEGRDHEKGRDFKLHTLTADQKLRKIRWSPLKLVKKVTACLPL